MENIFETTYKMKLPSSYHIREAFRSCLTKSCADNNCKCDIDIEEKWFLFRDHYTIKVTGNRSNINIIEKHLKIIAEIR